MMKTCKKWRRVGDGVRWLVLLVVVCVLPARILNHYTGTFNFLPIFAGRRCDMPKKAVKKTVKKYKNRKVIMKDGVKKIKFKSGRVVTQKDGVKTIKYGNRVVTFKGGVKTIKWNDGRVKTYKKKNASG